MVRPSKFHPAYNPIIFEYLYDGGAYHEIEIVIEGDTIILRRDYLNGVARFDVSRVVKSYFPSMMLDSISVVDSSIYKEPMLSVKYTVNGDVYYALNAVAQLRENINFSLLKNQSLKTLPYIKYYEGYPLDISILSEKPILTSAGSTIANCVSIVKVSGAGTITTESLNLTNNGDLVLNNGDQVVFGSTPLDTATEECIPSNPFYVRWVNFKGGREYYMFSYNQKRTVILSENNTYKRYISDLMAVNGTDYSYSKKAIEVVEVGALLNREEFDALTKMTLSNYIEVYDNGIWKRIIIEGASQVQELKDEYNEFTCSFLLPELNLQY